MSQVLSAIGRSALSEDAKERARELLSAYHGQTERAELVDLLDSLSAGSGDLPILTRSWDADIDRPIRALIESAGFSLIHLIRLSILLGEIQLEGVRDGRFSTPHDLAWSVVPLSKRVRILDARRGASTDLRQVAAALDAVGIDPDALGWSLLDHYSGEHALMSWSPDQIWPYFRERLAILEQIFDRAPPTRRLEAYAKKDRRRLALYVLSKFPEPPPSLEDMLWEIALGTAKTERPAARRCLAGSKRGDRRIDALRSGGKDARAQAALWIAELREASAIPDLEEALAKEKSDAVRGALMEALERLGVSIERFLDRGALELEAKAALEKGALEKLSWFPFDELPRATWADTKEVVPKGILAHLIGRGRKLGSPDPDPILRRYASMIEAPSRRAIGARVLDLWIERDLGAGSAVDDKGILAVASACAGGEVEPTVARYLAEHYGYRPAQCKALVRVLSWIDDPAATQRLMSVADRFRTRGIQAEARAAVEDLMERRGLTEEALADQSVPTCGFEREPNILDAGGRRFELVLDADQILLRDEGSMKVQKTLPAPRKDQDQERAAFAKKELAALKKTLKSAMTLQRNRLYAAMCSERTWSADDFQRFVLGHPLMKRLAFRLVWAFGDQTFRPLEDGTLTNAADEPVVLPRDARVRVAHGSTMPEAEASSWRVHLLDYEVDPLFDQVSKRRYEVGERETVDDFIGIEVEAFTLRGLLVGRGYVRGEVGDGGVFWAYVKSIGGIEAKILFSGNQLPEANNKVALGPLSFSKRVKIEGQEMADGIAPRELPPPLVAECVSDLADVAKTGRFDPEWGSKFDALW